MREITLLELDLENSKLCERMMCHACSYFTWDNMNAAEVYTTETANIANNPWVNNLQVNPWFALTAK